MRSKILLASYCIAATALGGWLLIGARASRPSSIDAVLDAPFIPARVARVMMLGFRSVASDAEFLQAIQVFGDRVQSHGQIDQRTRRAQAIARLLDYSTELDEQFIYAYVFGANAIPIATADGGMFGVQETIELLRKGTARAGMNCHGEVADQPAVNCDWRIPFYLAYMLTTYQADFRGASEAMAEAARRPKHPEYIELLATRLAAVGGAIETGLAMCKAMELNAETEDKKAEFRDRCLLLEMERDIRQLEEAVTAFMEKTGRLPSSLAEIQSAGLLSQIPPEPHGGTYEFDASTGKIRSTAAERLKLSDRVEREIEENKRRTKAQQKEAGQP